MIKYQTQDLIRRAQQLADLENSDFISWNENIMAINEAYGDIYQRAINRDEKFYLKECVISAGSDGDFDDMSCFELPEDFYQLYSLNDRGSNRCLVRNSINDPLNTTGYDIINNQLVIKGASSNDLLLKYFPVPQTLLYPAPNAKLYLDDFKVLIDSLPPKKDKDIVNSRMYVAGEILENQYGVAWKDLVTGEEKQSTENYIPIEIMEPKVIGCKDGGFILGGNTKEGKARYNYYDDEFNQIDPLGNDYPVLFLDPDKNPLFFDPIEGIFYSTDGFEYLKISKGAKDLLSQLNTAAYYLTGCVNREDNKCYFTEVSRANVKNTRNCYVYDFTKDSFEKVVNKNNSIKYIIAKNGVNLIYDMSTGAVNDFNYKYSLGSGFVGINKIDFNTGYGATKLDGTVKTFVVDTICDYPNNLFINMLAYKLAIMYKSKQGGDITGLGALFQQAESQFYDSLTRDDFSVTRIQNVY